ncbi:hypothetical protein C8R43DRAFT_1071604 [Mycena crocata]|nr:hypothetical protein C8R43DRAFT_1071604 [Mycena crocata]
MPRDLWNRPIINESVDGLNVKRPLELADWDRALFYLPRIRMLHCTATGTPSAQLVDTLGLCLPTDHLFPNIDTLHWDDLRSRFPLIRLVLGPRITSLEIGFCCDSASIPYFSLIPTLARKFPGLIVACIPSAPSIVSFPVPHSKLRESTSQFLRGLEHVQTVRVVDLDQPAIEHLACLPTLIDLTVSDMGSFSLSPQLTNTPLFLYLTSLNVSTTSVDVATAFTEAVAYSPLTELHITLTGSISNADLLTVYTIVSDSFLHSPLHQLQIGAEQLTDGVPGTVLEPLLSLTALKTLWLHAGRGFDLDDALVTDMARAWPQMTHLTFFGFDTDIFPRVTLEGLRAFAEHCPDLQWVEIPVHALEVPAPHTSPATRIVQRNLTRWSVGFSPIENAASVARFLSGIFPNLVSIQSNVGDEVVDHEEDDGGEEYTYHARWMVVRQVLPALAEARAEERSLVLLTD